MTRSAFINLYSFISFQQLTNIYLYSLQNTPDDRYLSIQVLEQWGRWSNICLHADVYAYPFKFRFSIIASKMNHQHSHTSKHSNALIQPRNASITLFIWHQGWSYAFWYLKPTAKHRPSIEIYAIIVNYIIKIIYVLYI